MPLLTPEGWALLGSLPPYDEAEALRLAESLREEGHSPGLVAAALSQQRLRARAEAKFGPFAASMLFTPDGLEQATRLSVAARHAARYAAAGVGGVADLGCGIGGDAMALAGLGLDVLAVERDEATAALATVNLMPFDRARVRCADALGIDLRAEGVDAVFADPARRAGGRRVKDPEQWSPALSELLAMRQAVPALGLKVAPGLDHGAIPDDAHAQWVSVDGTVVEAGLWFGPLAPEGPGRSALVLSTGADGEPRARRLTDPACTDPSAAPEQLEPVSSTAQIGELLLEPDGAAIRAGLVAELARRTASRPVGTRIAYLTGDTLPDESLTAFLRCWRVREVLPLNLKALRARVRERGIGRLEIHKRGLPVSPDTLRASLRLKGDGAETWVATRVGVRDERDRGAVLVVEPVPTKR
ncbi:class I SAM-dependent methyltransferase [Actinomyces timonensis]|uniref:Class I SAM-dependent methyltransferase n=1 Tax=Actinomyces timonensis TaxID=1288391 RepID=A0AAU8N628_9ACTO